MPILDGPAAINLVGGQWAELGLGGGFYFPLSSPKVWPALWAKNTRNKRSNPMLSSSLPKYRQNGTPCGKTQVESSRLAMNNAPTMAKGRTQNPRAMESPISSSATPTAYADAVGYFNVARRNGL